MSAKIITYGQQISAGSTAIPDNTSVALDIESTDAKDYVTISTDDSNPSIILGKDGAEVGIGVASPDALLHVQGTAISTARPDFNADTVAIFENDSNCSIQILTKDASAVAEINMGGIGEDREGNLRYIASEQKMELGPRNASSKMGLYTAGSQRIHIDANGKTAVGASTPKHLLHVQDGDLAVVTNSADDVAKSLVFTKSKNETDGGHTPVDDDTVLGNIVFKGSDSTGAFEPGAKIRAQVAAGTIGDGRVPSELIFSTAPDSASAPLDALVINPSGFVEVQSPTNGARLHFMDGATQRAGLKAFSGGLYVDTADSAHDIFFRPGGSTTSLCIDSGNTFVGILDVTPTKALDVKNGESGGDILCYDIYTHDGGVTSSDERMKENIVETQLGLDFINSLSPVSYKWKDTDEYSEMRTVPATDGEPEHEEVANTFEAVQYTRTHHGLIAQQVNQAVTDAGLTDTDFAGYTYDQERDQHGLRYQEFISPLIKAVQELTARVAELEGGD